MSDLLSIYLNDHLAGATAGVELVRRAQASNEGTELGALLAELSAELESDRESLRQTMAGLSIAESKAKVAAGWSAEKLGRLKLNGQLRGYSPLSRMLELEGLQGGIAAKKSLWEALDATIAGRLPTIDFAALAARAESQLDRLAPHRREAALAAFGAATAAAGS
ncbi:MAG: hypothetical protein ABW065_07245 [Solirubrobacterales bacterium]